MTAPAPMLTLREAAALLPGVRLVGDGGTPLLRVHTDSRSLQPGDLFVALRGERFDGHDFLPQARAAGAVAALAERGLDTAGLPGLLVEDALQALQQLARAWRARLHLPLIAVTGSNGKTTVTQMIASVLRAWQGDAALATRGNLNNHIGVPLTLLALRPAHRAAVVELGMNHPGEIALLAALAQPTVALVNNAQREHQEFMGSVEAVARENGSVLQALPADGVAVYPADDAQTLVWDSLSRSHRRQRFALQGPAEITATAEWQDAGAENAAHWQLQVRTPQGGAVLRLHAAGRHNLHNALATTACALAAGAPLAAVVQGLEAFLPVKGRSQLSTLAGGVTLIDDSYNANPDSVRAAIDVLASLRGPRWLVLGDMGEVGSQGPQFHAEVGAYARERGVEQLWAAGAACAEAARAFGAMARHFAEVSELLAALDGAPAHASVVVKGSRFMRMERVAEALRARATQGGSHAG
jgi:UDP-N-acetylmuramoyl-tripeptide--D-alanyl-D-alanine ligase